MHGLAISYPTMQRDGNIILFLLAGFVAVVVAAAPQTPFGGGSGPVRVLPAVGSSLVYTFNSPGILNETGTMGESTSPYWWVNSGGQLVIQGGTGWTMQGEAPLLNRWRIAYALSNPTDTDGGTHPQNLFRLVTKSVWTNVEVQTQFKIVKDNFSSSPNRNQSNGLLLISRYAGNGQTLYYAGVRVDGIAVIKKKINGSYYTLAQKRVFPGTYSILPSTGTSQNLLPHGEWLGLKSSTMTNKDGSVSITLSMQREGGAWQVLLQTTDRGDAAVRKTPPITGAAYIGVRTDFMDVQFASFRAKDLTL